MKHDDGRKQVSTTEFNVRERQVESYTIQLSVDEMDAIERLQHLLGHATLEETIIKAMNLYGVDLSGKIARIVTTLDRE